MNTVESNIRKHGHKRSISDLQAYIQTVPLEEITLLIEVKLTDANFISLWNYLMLGFDNSAESHKKLLAVALKALQELENNTVTSNHCQSIITRLGIELPKFKTDHLVKFCSFCVQCIQLGNVTNMSWRPLLPELLNILVDRELVEYNEIEYSGEEFKSEIINSLCMLEWSPNIVTSVAIMFKDMPFSTEEHLKVVNKLGKYFEVMTPHEIPVFVYNMLMLCRFGNSRSIFFRLQHYFGVRIYDRRSVKPESNSDPMDLIESAPDVDAINAECTVLFHIYQSAVLSHASIKDYLTSLKTLSGAPEFIMHPFQITALLTISRVSYYEEAVFDIIKACISRVLREEERKIKCCWFREMVPISVKLDDVFKQIIELSMNEKEVHVMQGVKKLTFILLAIGPSLGRDIITEKQWNLGVTLFLEVLKHQRRNAHGIIKNLCDSILTGRNVAHYTECLNFLCRNMTMLILQNQVCITELMEGLLQAPDRIGTQILEAIVPLIKISSIIRDQLILLLRKALFSRAIETRQIAVTGFIKFLKNIKITNPNALSDVSESMSNLSGHSVLTQISLSRTGQSAGQSYFTNEALCLEVLGILKKCFMQQAEVRIMLYKGLLEAISTNPYLSIPVLDLLWSHFSSFIIAESDVLPPLNLSAISLRKDVHVVLQEPLGQLIRVMGLILVKAMEIDEENSSLIKFVKALELLSEKMPNCELVHFELDDGTDLLDVLPESQQKCIVLKEAMSIYEALIDYKIISWTLQTEINANQINRLFQCYSRLLQFSKNITKPKKANKRKNDGEKSFENVQKNKKVAFKAHDMELSHQSTVKILNLLHSPEVDWASSKQANILKPKEDFHRYVMQAAINLIQSTSSVKTIEKVQYNFCTDIASILFKKCIVRLNEFAVFDYSTAVLTLECFHCILKLICGQHKDSLELFLCTVVGETENEEGLLVYLSKFIETYIKLFENEEDSNEDTATKEMSVCIINTLQLLTSQIPVGSNTISIKVLDWLKDFAKKRALSNKQVAISFVNLLLNFNLKFKNTTTLLENVSKCLIEIIGSISTEHENTVELKLINEQTAFSVLQALCNNLKAILDDCDWLILRMKADFRVLIYPGEDNPTRKREILKNKERGICCQMCLIINIINAISDLTVPLGIQCESILKNISHLFNTLNSLTKYFMMRSSKINPAFQYARFERVVKLAGKHLSPTVNAFILYIEENQKTKDGDTQKKTKKCADAMKNKVLRETKLVPKVVYEIEQFSKSVIQLSKKTKIDLAKYVGQGTARDFRILHFQEVLDKVQNDPIGTQTNTTAEESNTDTDLNTSDPTNEEEASTSSHSTPSKKMRK